MPEVNCLQDVTLGVSPKTNIWNEWMKEMVKTSRNIFSYNRSILIHLQIIISELPMSMAAFKKIKMMGTYTLK